MTESTDAANGVSTIYEMSVGDTFSGTLGSFGDRDWIEIELTAGDSYQISLTGGTLRDPYLRLHSSDGTQIALDDDGGSGLDSLLTFTATTSGTYYIDAGAYADRGTGTYTISVEEVDAGSILPTYTNDEIATQLVEGYWTWAGATASQSFDIGADRTLDVDITELTSIGQQFATWALEAWSYATGITFNFVDESIGATADIFFDDNNSGAYASNTTVGTTITRSTINVSTSWHNGDIDSSGNAILNSYSTQTYIHEIGHALGLGHSGNYNGSASYGTTTVGSDNHYLNDSWQATVMSYFSQTENSSITATYAFILSPMIADILAIQSLYGTASVRTGDTTYGENSNVGGYFDDISLITTSTAYAYTILDSGGTDTLDLTFATAASRVDLTPESYSDIGGRTGNLAIARDTIIENVILGSYDDTVIGNEANNRIVTGGGSDTVDGGAGSADVVVLAGNRSEYTITTSSDTTTVTGRGDTVTLTNVEQVEFDDQTESIGATSYTYAYYWYNGYDLYYGWTYDSDGSQGLYAGYTYSATDENGNSGYYYVYSSTAGNTYGLSEDQAVHDYYYDYETNQYDYDPYYSTTSGYALGSGMVGSYDYVDFDDGVYSEGIYGWYGYREADDENPEHTYYYYWYNGYDLYYGWTYDSDGSQGLYAGYTYSATDENGNSGYYYVYSSTAGNTYGLSEDQAVHDYYYDYETNQYDYDPYYSTTSGYALGSGMVGSYDYVDFDDGVYSEGIYGWYGYREADDENPEHTYYYYWYNGYDLYYGWTYDSDGSQGLYAGYTYSATDENGISGYYYVYSSTAGNTYGLSEDQAVHDYYYDYETNQYDYDPYYSTTSGYALGSGMVGSYDYVDFDDGVYSEGIYGWYGYREADDENPEHTYYYYWYNGYDLYYGWTYDSDGSQGLYAGYTYSATDENGNSGYYYVYSSTAGNTYGLSEDQAVHDYYYDYETNQYDYDPYYSTTSGYALGSGMVGSYDYVDFDDGVYSEGIYGWYGYREADDGGTI